MISSDKPNFTPTYLVINSKAGPGDRLDPNETFDLQQMPPMVLKPVSHAKAKSAQYDSDLLMSSIAGDPLTYGQARHSSSHIANSDIFMGIFFAFMIGLLCFSGWMVYKFSSLSAKKSVSDATAAEILERLNPDRIIKTLKDVVHDSFEAHMAFVDRCNRDDFEHKLFNACVYFKCAAEEFYETDELSFNSVEEAVQCIPELIWSRSLETCFGEILVNNPDKLTIVDHTLRSLPEENKRTKYLDGNLNTKESTEG